MDQLPPRTLETLLETLRGPFENRCRQVADVVHRAPTGPVRNHSEEPVRDLLADFRQTVYQTAVPLRIDAAEAAFSPGRPNDRPAARP
jgi:hypothetical protein